LSEAGWRTLARRALLAPFVFLWLGGVGSQFLLGGTPPHVAWTAPVFLLLASLLVALEAPAAGGSRLALAALGGFLVEVVSIRTGWIFGNYAYTDRLGPSFAGVPLVMLCAWLVLLAYAGAMTNQLGLRGLAAALTGGVWMTAVDLVLDPLAAGRFDYWRWPGGGAWWGVPVRNFAGWFVVSSALLLVVVTEPGARVRVWARRVGLSIIVFFSAIAVAARMPVVAIVGLGLVAAHLAASRFGARHGA
jgi:putative membrane protein